MATKFEARIIGRLLDRLAKGGLDAALEYGVAVCGGNPQIAKFVLANAPKPLKILLQASFAARTSKKQFAHAEMVAQRAADLQARNLVIEAFVADFQGHGGLARLPYSWRASQWPKEICARRQNKRSPPQWLCPATVCAQPERKRFCNARTPNWHGGLRMADCQSCFAAACHRPLASRFPCGTGI